MVLKSNFDFYDNFTVKLNEKLNSLEQVLQQIQLEVGHSIRQQTMKNNRETLRMDMFVIRGVIKK